MSGGWQTKIWGAGLGGGSLVTVGGRYLVACGWQLWGV